jgi:hypothetical protein
VCNFGNPKFTIRSPYLLKTMLHGFNSHDNWFVFGFGFDWQPLETLSRPAMSGIYILLQCHVSNSI